MSRDAKERKLRRQRDRDFQKKRATRAYENPPDSLVSAAPGTIALSYDVSFDPIHDTSDSARRRLEAVVGESAMEELHAQVHEDQAKAIPTLERLVVQFPDVPMVYNWLAVSYAGVGDFKKADSINRLSFEKFPDYVFARVHECNRLLEEGDI